MPLFASTTSSSEKKYIGNPDLEYITESFKGNAINRGVFQNLYGHVGGDSLVDVLKWRFSINSQRQVKKNERYALPVKPVSGGENIFSDNEESFLWLGHASWLIRAGGKTILTDPCLTSPLLVKRRTCLPIPLEGIKPDYLLVSHGHLDHLDTATLKHCSGSSALVPLNMTGIITKANPTIVCQEAGWYQQYTLDEDFQVIFLPAHHWHRRASRDYNRVLWGSFLIKTRGKTIFFCGDSAYSPHFQDINEVIGSVDIALMPIGAYAPRWFMKSSHINPEEAIQAGRDLEAKQIVPMHYGTFDLSDEPLGEPEQRIRALSAKASTCSSNSPQIRFVSIGEKMLLSDKA